MGSPGAQEGSGSALTSVTVTVNGVIRSIEDDGGTLLEALRDGLALRSVKDGCSPQGQCGCCTVLVDGQPRVSCVTPLARAAGRTVTTLEGLPSAGVWADAFLATGGSQCGFCTPGIVMRLASANTDARSVGQCLLAHLCRCTGWQTIIEAAALVHSDRHPVAEPGRDLDAASDRASIEGRSPQRVSTEVGLGRAGFTDDSAPIDALVAVRAEDGAWVVGASLTDARRRSGKVQGRRSTEPAIWPIEVPSGRWSRVLQTTWVDPAYVELDAAWCAPGADPVYGVANGGGFAPKALDDLGSVARRLADEHHRSVRVLASREDLVRFGVKRPPMAIGVDAAGHGVVVVRRTPGIAEVISSFAPGLEVREVDVAGPPTSAEVRGAGWAEVAVVAASLTAHDAVISPDGAQAEARIDTAGVHVRVRCGSPIDRVVLRSYCIGATHQALGWVRSERITVVDGAPRDLTVRSFGIIRAIDMLPVEIEIIDDDTPAVNGSDAVFAAVAAAAWRAAGHPRRWPINGG